MRNASPLHPVVLRGQRAKAQIKELQEARRVWVAGLEAGGEFYRLFNYLPGVFFFVKDQAGRTMFVSQSILDLYQMNDESEMLGLTDYDLNSVVMAENYVRDDQKVLSGEVKQVERLELWFDRLGMPDWFVVTKLPVRSQTGRISGVMGMLRRASENEKQLPVFQTVAKAVELIRRDYEKPIRIEAVAERCGQSLRQLQRHFQTAFGTTPQEFLIKTRLLAACHLLEETRLTVGEVALNCGFVDASAFTQQFRVRMGKTPIAYRQTHQTAAKAKSSTGDHRRRA